MTDDHRQGNRAGLFPFLISFVKKIPYAARLIEFILHNPLYKSVLILGSGTAVAQLIGIVSMPVITRLYTPSDLGILAVYSSILAIIGIGATLRYEYAFTLPQKDEDAVNLFGLCLILLFVTTTGLAFVLFFGSGLLITGFDLGSIEPYFWFLLAGFFGMGLYTILNFWAIRQRDYKRITYTKINQGAGGSACKILLGILSFGPMGLIIGHIVSQVAGIGTLARAVWRKELVHLISLQGMRGVAKTYRSFPVFNLPASIVNSMSLQLPALMLLAVYDSRIVGFYSLGYLLIVLPGSVISDSMGQAYLGEASRMVRERSRELHSLYVRTLRHLSMIAVPLIGIPALCAPFVVPVIFGGAWAEAGWYCWPLALMVIPQFIASPIGHLSLYGYNHWAFIWNVTRVVGIALSFYISYVLEFPVLLTLLFYALIMLVMYGVGIALNLKAIDNFTSKQATNNYNYKK